MKERDFPTTPREVVVTDTTYVWSDQDWRYLATVMDLFTREILGWSFPKNNDSKLVCQALWNASEQLKNYQKGSITVIEEEPTAVMIIRN